MSEFDPCCADDTNPTSNIEPPRLEQSSSSFATKVKSLDDILRKCGDFGRFQMIHFFFINIIAMCAGLASFYYVFAAADLDHRCRLPSNIWPNDISYYPVNETHEKYLNIYIPQRSNLNKYERCQQYNINHSNSTLIPCPNGWVYDRSVFGYTFTEEANLICNNQLMKSWLAALMQLSGFTLIVAGSLADRYGRKKMTIMIITIIFSTCLSTQIIMRLFSSNVKLKFFLLLINQFASGLTLSSYCLVFILMLELTSVAHTSLTANLAFISFTIGEIIVTSFAYIVRDWENLKWANITIIGLAIPYLYFMPESPLYLYSQAQYEKLKDLLKDIARINRRKEREWLPLYEDFINNKASLFKSQKEMKFFEKFYRILIRPVTMIRLLITGLIGFTTLLLYYKISYGLAMTNMSPYLAILIGAVVEAISYITSSVLTSTKLGRKGSFIIMMCLTIVSMVLVRFSKVGNLFLVQFQKYAISGAIAVSWIYIPELFPTSIRSTANGIFIASSRIGAIVATINDASFHQDYLFYTFYLALILAVLVALLSLILPETKDKPMDDVQDYIFN